MDFLQHLFLESPVRLGILSFVLLAVALFGRRRFIDTIGPRLVPGALALIVGLHALQYFVVTDREEILSAMDEFVAAIESNDIPHIDAAIGQPYDSEGMGQAEIVEFVRRRLEHIKIYDTRFHRSDVAVADDRAEMIVAARATVSIDGGVGQMHWGRWRIDWLREGASWRIVAIRPLMLDGQDLRGMNDLRGMMP